MFENYSEFPLHFAVAHGKVDDVKKLLAEGANIRERVSFPQSHYTSYDDEGNPTEEPPSPTEYERVPFEPMDCLGGLPWQYDYAPIPHAIECMHILTAAGATTNTERNSLMQLLSNAKTRVVANRRLICEMIRTTDCDVNWDGCHYTLLEGAMNNSVYDVVEVLLDAGAVMTTYSFWQVVAYAPLEVMLVFLQHGANPYVIDTKGKDAMDWIRDEIKWSAGVYYYQECEDLKNDRKLKFLGDLFECRRKFDAIKHDVHRELMEIVWNPQRLAKFGYFEL